LSDKDRVTLMLWRIWRADATRPLRWTQSLKRSIEALSTAPTAELAAIFWIRLYGVLTAHGGAASL
jgi:hypothetical protein